jgi:hypothetical protein
MFPRLPQLPGRIALKDPDIWINRRLPVDEAASHFRRYQLPSGRLFLATVSSLQPNIENGG